MKPSAEKQRTLTIDFDAENPLEIIRGGGQPYRAEPFKPSDWRMKFQLVAMLILSLIIVIPWVVLIILSALGRSSPPPTEHTTVVSVIVALYFSNNIITRFFGRE